MTILPALLWILFAFEGGVAQEVARYATGAECEIGRTQWEMQHPQITACERAR